MEKLNLCRVQNQEGVFTFCEKEEFIGFVLKEGRQWEPLTHQVYGFVLKESDVALNVGSHIGCHAIPISRRCKEVHAFEPQKMTFWLLRNNVLDNDRKNIHYYNKAVGHKDGLEVSISDVVQDSASAGDRVVYDGTKGVNFGGLSLGQGSHKVPMVTIDSLGLDVNFLLMDVEGAEPLVFYGAQKTIQKCRPFIIFECNAKKITADMRSVTHSTPLEENFSIIEFVKSLRYQKPVCVNEDIILAPIPEKPPVLAARYVGGITVSDRIYIPDRVPADFIMLDDAIIAFFLDQYIILKGTVKDGCITWTNSTVWIPDDKGKEKA